MRRATVAISIAMASMLLSGCGGSSGIDEVKIDTKTSGYTYIAPNKLQGSIVLHNTTPETGETIYLANVDFQSDECQIIDDSLKDRVDITNKNSIDFTVTLADNCYTNKIVASGTKMKVWADGGKDAEVFQAVIPNKQPVTQQERKNYAVIVNILDGKYNIMDYETKQLNIDVKYLGSLIDPDNVESITVKSDNPAILGLQEELNGEKRDIVIFQQKPHVAVYVARKSDKSGLANVTVEVKAKSKLNPNIIYTFKQSKTFTIEPVINADMQYSASLIIANRKPSEPVEIFDYKPVQSRFVVKTKEGVPLPSERIEKITITSDAPELITFSDSKDGNYGAYFQAYSLSNGIFYIKRVNSAYGTVNVIIEAKIKDKNDPTVTKTITYKKTIYLKPVTAEQTKYAFDVYAPSGYAVYRGGGTKPIVYQLKRDGKILDAEHIKKLTISTSDINKVMLVTQEGNVTALIENNEPTGTFYVKAGNKNGNATINIEATVIGKDFPDQEYVISKKVDVISVAVPEKFYSFDIHLGSIVNNQYSALYYKVRYPESAEIVDSERVSLITLTSNTDNLQFINKDGTLSDTYYITKSSDGVIPIKINKSNGDVANIKIEADIVSPNAGKLRITNYMDIKLQDYAVGNSLGGDNSNTQSVGGKDSNQTTVGDIKNIIIDQKPDYYDAQLGKFIKEITIKAQGAKKYTEVTVGAIMPRIGNVNMDNEPTNFYKKENENVLLDDIYGDNTGVLEGNIFYSPSLDSAAADYQKSFKYINPETDKLVIIPNPSRKDITYLGSWDIESVDQNDSMKYITLQNRYDGGKIDKLSWAIGSTGRLNPLNDTISVLDFDKERIALDEEGRAVVKLRYPTFLIGKDVLFYADFREVDENGTIIKKGNTYKTTLRGGDIDGQSDFTCMNANCTYPVLLKSKETGEPISYTHLDVTCQSQGVDAIEFSKDNSGYIRTDKYGKFSIKITSHPNTYTDENNNTVTTYSGFVNCSYNVSSEFKF